MSDYQFEPESWRVWADWDLELSFDRHDAFNGDNFLSFLEFSRDGVTHRIAMPLHKFEKFLELCNRNVEIMREDYLK